MIYQRRWLQIGVIVLLVTGYSFAYAHGEWGVMQKQDPDNRDYFSIAFTSSKEGWVVGSSVFDMDYPGFIGHTKDGGLNWSKAEVDVNKNLSAVYFYDEKHGWAIGAEGTIVATKNGGERWDIQTSKVGNDLYSVFFVSPKTGFVVGMGETILQTTNGGNTWKILRGGEAGSGVGEDDTSVFNAIHFADNSTGWVAGVRLSPRTGGQDGLIQKTVDGGKNWVDQPTHIEDILKDVFFVNASTGWAVGENGVILHTTNGGDTWEIQSSGTEEHLLSVQFASDTVGWAVGGDFGVNAIIHTTDGGKTWQKQEIGDPQAAKIPVKDIFVRGERAWVTGNSGLVMQYR